MTTLRTAALALLLAAACPTLAAAAPDWDRVELETSTFVGDQPSGWPIWQTVSVDHEGEVSIRHFSISHSERFSGLATRDQIEALDRAIQRARLGEGMPAKLDPDSRDFTLAVESRLATRRGQVQGHYAELGRQRRRLKPLLDAVLAIAEPIVHPVRRDDVFVGRVDASGWDLELVRGGGFRVEVEPEEFAERLEALDGALVEVRGRVRRVSSRRYVLEAEELLSPRRETLSGRLEGDALVVGERRVALSGPGLAVLQAAGVGAARVEAYTTSGPRGLRSALVTGVYARARERDYPFETGDELLITGMRAWGNRVDARRTSDGRESWTRLERLELLGPTTGITGALGGLGR